MQNAELDVVDPVEALLAIGALASVITNLKPKSLVRYEAIQDRHWRSKISVFTAVEYCSNTNDPGHSIYSRNHESLLL